MTTTPSYPSPGHPADVDLFRSTRAATMSLAAGLTETQAAFTPAPGKWSAGEVLDHILLAEKLYRDQFTQLIALARAGKKAEIARGFDDIDVSILFIPKAALPMMAIPFRIMNLFTPAPVREAMVRYRLAPAQAPKIAEPRKGRKVNALRQELGSSLRETISLFENSSGLDYRAMRASHPLMGTNNLLQLVRIMTMHEQRHQEQIRVIQRSPVFPQRSSESQRAS
jgi:hypothetical protein